jgi:hypothetical protein
MAVRSRGPGELLARGFAPARLATGALVATLGASALWLAWSSRGWPLIHDAPLMHYAAWRIADGAVPYRDLFDMNAPGVYLLHLVVLEVLGGGAGAWRLFDLSWLALSSGLIALYARPFGAGPAAVGALLFALYHLSGGPWLAGQRDFLVCALLLGGVLLVAEARGAGRLILAGALGGAAVVVKPPAAIFVGLLMAAGAGGAGSGGRAAVRGAGAVLLGGLLAPLGCLAWLTAAGGLAGLVDVFASYVLPLYSGLARVSLWTALGWWPFGRWVWALLGVLVLAACASARWERRRALAVAGVACGVVHFLVQGKGWEYQLYPLAAFACLSAGIALGNPRPLPRWTAIAASALLAVTLAAKGVQEREPGWIVAKHERAGRIAADLAGRLGAVDTVQVLDTTEGGIDALFRLRARQPSRFIYDFHFFHDEGHPVVRRLRDELMDALGAHPPRFVVVLQTGWPSGRYERLERFPALATWLGAHYALDREGAGYRIYARRAGS